MLSAQPHPTIRSAPWISSAASGEENPPETSRDHGLPLNRPLATADVATSAPTRSANASSASRQPGPRAPRPATKTGRSASRSAATSRATASSLGATGSSATWVSTLRLVDPCPASMAWTGSGRLRITVRRSSRARRNAATPCSTAVSADVIRAETAPTDSARAVWSTQKLDCRLVTSAARTSNGVRLFAASAIPVMALVSPQPWWTLSSATPPPIRL